MTILLKYQRIEIAHPNTSLLLRSRFLHHDVIFGRIVVVAVHLNFSSKNFIGEHVLPLHRVAQKHPNYHSSFGSIGHSTHHNYFACLPFRHRVSSSVISAAFAKFPLLGKVNRLISPRSTSMASFNSAISR